MRESVTTELVIDSQRSSTMPWGDDVTRLAFNHGETCLMAAVSESDLTIYSLLPFHEARSSPEQLAGPMYARLLTVPFPAVLAMGWTGNGKDLILSDQRCQITCLRVTSQQNAPAPETLTRRSAFPLMTGSVEILWVQKASVRYQCLAPGWASERPFAAASSKDVRVFTPEGTEHRVQSLRVAVAVTAMQWSPVKPTPSASMKPCLLTVEANGIMKIWVESPKPEGLYLGSCQLLSPDAPPCETAYYLEVVIEPENENLVESTMQACWVESFPGLEEDPRLAWIVATYQIQVEDRIEAHCSVYVVHGLPVELEGTIVSSSDPVAFLRQSCKLGDVHLPVTSIKAILLRPEPLPRLLLTQSSVQGNSAETRSVIMSVDTSTQETLELCMESNSVQEIVGFASSVLELLTHPRQDCVCVLTEDHVVSIWDLWPVRKLAEIHAAHFDLGAGIYALSWIDLGHRYAELGHLLLVGDLGAVVCSVNTHQESGKPVISLHQTASQIYDQALHPTSLTELHVAQEAEFREARFLLRSRGENEIYSILSVQQHSPHNAVIEVRTVETPFTDAEGCTVLEPVLHNTASLVAGTHAGTLEFFTLADELEWVSSFELSWEGEPASFVSCISTCAHAAYIACVTSFDEHQNEDKIHIVQSESMRGRLNYRLEDSFVSSSGIISQMAWSQAPSPFLSLVVGYQAGEVEILVRKRQGLWVPVGKYTSRLEVSTLTTTRHGLPVVGCGRHMLFLSTDAHIHSVDDEAVMQMAQAVGGAFPDYHHIPLLALLQMGHLKSVRVALKELASFVEKWEKTPEAERLEEAFAPTINGPCTLLGESFTERLVPEMKGFSVGQERLHCVPFEWNEEPKPEDLSPPDILSSMTHPSELGTQDSGLLTGQFDFSQFNNDFNDAPKAKYEATGLLDMSAFGISLGSASSESEEEEVTEKTAPPVDSPATEIPPSIKARPANGITPSSVEKEDCVLLMLEPSFEDDCSPVLDLQSGKDTDFDPSYLHQILENYISEDNGALPLNCLLKISRSNANVLLEIVRTYQTWASELTASALDVAGMKVLAAVKLTAVASKCRPKRPEAKNNLSALRKEDYTPFLKSPYHQAFISAASIATQTSVSTSTVVDERLTQSYVSWPESAGLAPGIEAIHILWALESRNPSELLNACLDSIAPLTELRFAKQGQYSWERLRSIGAGFWIRDPETAASVADRVAKEQFKQRNDPHDCALMYIALKKQMLLSRLFRSNALPRVADLLAQDFSKEIHRQTASKNAYVLLGQHRYSLAAAFFLIGGYYQDAIGVCAKEMGDPQMALFLTNLIQTSDPQLIEDIIMKEVFPHAVAADDRVAQGMLLWLLNKRMEALKAITTVKALKSELSIHDRSVSKILLLQFVLWRGLTELSGRFVPIWMCDQIKNVAAHCAHVLEACGMPSLALRVLQICQSLEALVPTAEDPTLYRTWIKRLVTDMMMTHLPSPHAVMARDPAMILWHQHIHQDVATLNGMGVHVEGEEIFQCMQYVMDCLYDVPSSPILPKQVMHRPDLSGRHARDSTPLVSGVHHMLEKSAGEKDETEEAAGKQIVQPESTDLLHVEGDRCVGVCFSKEEGFYGSRHPKTKRIAVATAKHGIHYIDWDPAEEPLPSPAYRSLYEKFERSRWPSLTWLREASAVDRLGNPISMKEVMGGPLKSHPSSNLYLSGCGEESILLWQYGVGVPCARFVLESANGFEAMHRLTWSGTGDRIAAIGNNGICGFWDLASAHHNHSLSSANWAQQIAARRGHDVEFVNGSGSVIATTGEDEAGKGQFSLWDTLAPQSSSRVAHMEYRYSVTELTTIPGTLLFVSAQDSGSVRVHDFRMIGGSNPKELWSLNYIHDGPITSLEIGWVPTGVSSHPWELCLATGGRDGDICLVNEITTSGHLRQRLRRAHWKKTGQLAHLLLSGFKGNLGNVSVAPFGVQRTHPESASGVPVLDMDWCDEGLLTAGADGFVQLFPFAS